MADIETQHNPAPEVVETVVVIPNPIPRNRPRKVSSSMWGPMEIASVAIGVMALVGALAAYFLFVIPSNRELIKNKSDADRLEAEVISAKSKYGEITNTQDQVGKLVQSVDDFEGRFLPMPVNGQTALYQRLNALIASYDLVNTTGPDYSPLEAADLNGDKPSEEEKGRAKYRSLYPGLYVSTTLEGSYQNLRRFIREIETGREFIIVSSVELAPSDSDGQKQKDEKNPVAAVADTETVRTLNPGPAGPTGIPNRNMYPPGVSQPGFSQPGFNQPGVNPQVRTKPAAKGKMHGEIVSLHIELAAYFRRPNSAPIVVAK
ncbi:hypothetical protein BH10ACI2_BH10ACI2_12020 [soil metagenome]